LCRSIIGFVCVIGGVWLICHSLISILTAQETARL
jgi:hypothetical protein